LIGQRRWNSKRTRVRLRLDRRSAADAASSRSLSESSFQAPTDVRSSPRPGRSPTITPPAASRSRLSSAAASAQATSVVTPRSLTAWPARAARRRAGGPAAPAARTYFFRGLLVLGSRDQAVPVRGGVRGARRPARRLGTLWTAAPIYQESLANLHWLVIGAATVRTRTANRQRPPSLRRTGTNHRDELACLIGHSARIHGYVKGHAPARPSVSGVRRRCVIDATPIRPGRVQRPTKAHRASWAEIPPGRRRVSSPRRFDAWFCQAPGRAEPCRPETPSSNVAKRLAHPVPSFPRFARAGSGPPGAAPPGAPTTR
jgi:hypothetical protein